MSLTIDQAIQHIQRTYPFKDHIAERNTYLTVGQVVLRYLRPGSRVLDFGSGPCDRTALLSALGFDCTAYDDLADEWHKQQGVKEAIFAFAEQSGIDFRLANAGPLPFEPLQFDMVMMHNVLEHLHDSPRDLVLDLLGTAKPESLFFATVPNAVNIRKRVCVVLGKTNHIQFEKYYWSPYPWRGHIREYTRNDLVKLARYLDLEVLELDGCHQMLRKLPNSVRPVYIAMTSLFRGWRDSWMLVARKRPGWSPKRILPDTEWKEILGDKWL